MSLLMLMHVLGKIPVSPTISAISDPVTSFVFGSGGDRPVSGLRFTTGGDIQESDHDTGGGSSYVKVGEWVDDKTGLDNTDWEVQIEVNSEDNGDPGTWSGDTLEIFRVLSTQRTYEWTKDGNDLGTANTVVTITLRQVSNTGNSTSRSSMDFDAEIGN